MASFDYNKHWIISRYFDFFSYHSTAKVFGSAKVGALNKHCIHEQGFLKTVASFSKKIKCRPISTISTHGYIIILNFNHVLFFFYFFQTSANTQIRVSTFYNKNPFTSITMQYIISVVIKKNYLTSFLLQARSKWYLCLV